LTNKSKSAIMYLRNKETRCYLSGYSVINTTKTKARDLVGGIRG